MENLSFNFPVESDSSKKNETYPKHDRAAEYCFYSKKILAHLDGELRTGISNFMDKHLETCKLCQNKQRKFKISLELISSYIVKKNISGQALQEINKEIKGLLKGPYQDLEKINRSRNGGVVRKLVRLFKKAFSYEPRP